MKYNFVYYNAKDGNIIYTFASKLKKLCETANVCMCKVSLVMRLLVYKFLYRRTQLCIRVYVYVFIQTHQYQYSLLLEYFWKIYQQKKTYMQRMNL